MWIVELDGRPFAFSQDYDVHGWTPHPFSYLPPGSRGIDPFIGEADLLDRGHGTAFVRAHVERMFAAGAEPMDTPWGRAVLMECWPSKTTDRAGDIR